jgi:dihydrofolate reductase
MRKLKLQVQTTLDGFIAGPEGEMDWAIANWSQDLNEFVMKLTVPVDTILLGRKLAEGFIPHWTAAYNNPAGPEEGSQKMVETPKIVFSKTMASSPWERTIIAKGDLKEEVHALKNKEGGDLIVYGGAGLVSSLIREKLIDELHFFVNPVIIGSGMPIFREVTEKQSLKLVSSQSFECGIVALTYHYDGTEI